MTSHIDDRLLSECFATACMETVRGTSPCVAIPVLRSFAQHLLAAAPTKSALSSGDLLLRLRQRVLHTHGGNADALTHHWNLTENDSAMHKEAADRIAELESLLAAASIAK